MKKIIASAFALTMAAGGGYAESHSMTGASSLDMGGMKGNLIRSRDITGGTIYSMAEGAGDTWDASATWDAMDNNWNDIGEIEDLVLSRDGKVTGIVAEIGGFLDIGDKHVVIAVDDLNLVAIDDATYAYVTRLSEEQLEELPGVDEGFWD